MATESSLRIYKANVELLHGEFVQFMRWEILQVIIVYQNDSSEALLFGTYVDANNLCGDVMQNDKFPQLDFTVNADITLAELQNYSDNNPVS